MNNFFQHLRDTDNVPEVNIPFDPTRTPREQIEAAIATLPPRRCGRHPHELLLVDRLATIRSVLSNGGDGWLVGFNSIYDRCSRCPHSHIEHDFEVEQCPVGVIRLGRRDLCARDGRGRPVPQQNEWRRLDADQSPQQQFGAWLTAQTEFRCQFSNEVLRRRKAKLKLPFETLTCQPQHARCLQCELERLGLSPDEAGASFDNFNIVPAEIQKHVDVCRSFAADPVGVLLLLGNVGTGKTHLSASVVREQIGRGGKDLRIIKHRQFLTQHWQSLRPVAFGDEPPTSPLASCQKSSLLVYDELTATMDSGRAHEDVLLDLFEHRIGYHKPTIITANLNPSELESVLGSRLYDRLRRAAFAVLEFGFESKRKSLNADYLKRGQAKT